MRRIDPTEPCPCGSGKPYGDCHIVYRAAERPQSIRRKFALQVIPEPEPGTRSVFEKSSGADDSVFFTSAQTDDAYVCGRCGCELIVGTPIGQFQNLVLKCSGCRAFNETKLQKAPRRQRKGHKGRE
jgi:hypothetical protein